MSTVVTLTLPDEIVARANDWAKLTGIPVADLLTEVIEHSLAPAGRNVEHNGAIESWSDARVVAAAEAELPSTDDQRLSELLYRQQAGMLSEGEKNELKPLMGVYQGQLLLKARALREAVRRGLRE